jgi:translation initiation factor 2-alpha kinase 4
MPHKNKKKQNNATENGSPQKEKPPCFSESSPTKGSALATTNYREIHQNEAEALQSIYGEDFENVEQRRAAWQVSTQIFAVKEK